MIFFFERDTNHSLKIKISALSTKKTPTYIINDLDKGEILENFLKRAEKIIRKKANYLLS